MFSSPVSIRLSSGTSRIVCRGAVVDGAHADIDLVDAQRRRRERGLDRIGQMIVQPRLHLADELAEAQHDAELVGLDAEEAGKAPQRDRHQRDQRDAAAAEIARQQAAQPVLAAAQEFFQIGRPRAAGGCGPEPQGPRGPEPHGPPPPDWLLHGINISPERRRIAGRLGCGGYRGARRPVTTRSYAARLRQSRTALRRPSRRVAVGDKGEGGIVVRPPAGMLVARDFAPDSCDRSAENAHRRRRARAHG